MFDSENLSNPSFYALLGMLVIAVTTVIWFIIAKSMDERDDEEHRRQKVKVKEFLDTLTLSCDGQSLIIHTPVDADPDIKIRVLVTSRLIQVFRFTTPGYEDFEHLHDPHARRGSPAGERIHLEDSFDSPVTVTPRTKGMTTAELVRNELLPRRAAELNLDQTAIDATVVELIDHRISYTLLSYPEEKLISSTSPVTYRPAPSKSDPD